jgi:HPr kinase/phosphorylase
MSEKVLVKDCVDALKLEVISGEEYLDREVTRSVLSRPSVEIYGDYFTFYESNRIQIIGSKEYDIFSLLDADSRAKRIEKLFAGNPPAFVFTKNVLSIPQEFVDASVKYKIPILKTNQSTTTAIRNLSNYLTDVLAERISLHAVLLDINGVGVLITGKSAVGKSETALELVHRGHVLVADDRVEVSQQDGGYVYGEAPVLTERLMEIRGLGIIDVVDLFGAKAFRRKKRIMLVVNLVKWDKTDQYDRIGLQEEYEYIFDMPISKVTVPVQPGRNLATLVEIAAMNWRLKSFGRNAASEFVDKLNKIVKTGGNNQ